MKKEFLDLGRQPIANKFLREDEFDGEWWKIYNSCTRSNDIFINGG